MDDELDLPEMCAVAEKVVDGVVPFFKANLGAPPVLTKARGDYATEADLHIERKMAVLLESMSGYDVLGEEYGGQPAETYWVVDPIDGTSNYAVGYPMCGILVALIHRGEPVVAVSAFPFLRQRYMAYKGGGLRINGHRVPRLTEPTGARTVGFGSIIARRDKLFPMEWRQRLLNAVGQTFPSMRIDGSVGVDLALTASGAFAGSVTFSPHRWDNAAGVLLIREAGGIATDVFGKPWHPGSHGVLAGTPRIHEQLLEIVQSLELPHPTE